MKRLLSRIAGSVLAFAYPARCLACGLLFYTPPKKRPTANDTSFVGLTAAFLCPGCSTGFSPANGPLCTRCGVIFAGGRGDDHVCGACLARPTHFRQARASGCYDGSLLTITHRLKYQGDSYLAKPLGRLLFQTYCDHFGQTHHDTIAPVPLHGTRMRKRGYNQAYLLIKNWNRYASTTDRQRPAFTLTPDLLKRCRATPPQTGQDRRHRLANIKNAFTVPRPESVVDQRILLVDDVFTTGATVNECARVLLKNGAARVDVLTLARAM